MESSSFILSTYKQFLCKFFQLNIQLNLFSNSEYTQQAECMKNKSKILWDFPQMCNINTRKSDLEINTDSKYTFYFYKQYNFYHVNSLWMYQ